MRALWAVLVLAGSVCADLQHSTSVEVRARDNWTLEARWNDSGEARAYEVQVARTDLFQVMFQGNVSAAEKLGAWVWRSPLPLQCADHSVRVRSFNSTGVSAWSQWATNKGQQNVPSTTARVFPTGEVLLEGSSALFCCIPPVGAQVTEIQFSHRPYDMTAIDQHVRVIRVDSLNCTKLGVTTSCWTNTTRSKSVLNYVTFPPERPQNLSCWTTDLQSIKCSWTAGRPPNLSNKNYQRRYTLHVQDSDQAEVQCDEDPCVFPALPGRIFYNITVVVRNKLGEENQSYAFHFSQVLFPVPESVIVSAEVTDANVSWDLRGNFSGLHFICQILLEPTGNTTELQFVARSRQQRVSVIVQQLQPNTMYSTRGRCALQGNDWGPWTASQTFHTVPLVTLDIWTNIRQQVHNRMLTVLWKTLPSGSEVDIVGFEVCVEPCSAHSPRFVKELQVNFTVGFGECTVSVRALTSRGPSVKSRISVPALYAENLLREKRIVGNAKGFELSWSSLSSATCGYTVEWCMTSPTVPCDLRWRRVPANQTSLLLSEGEGFRKGCRYTFRIFSCQAEGHQVHEKHIGYLEEQRPLDTPELLHPMTISWPRATLHWRFNETDPSHPGFITGYRLIIQDHADCSDSKVFLNISVDDPHCKSVLVEGLQPSRSYTVCLTACTQAGCGADSAQTITTTQNLYLLLAKVVTPLLMLIGCCLCLWPCRETLKGITGDIFSVPSAQSMKVLELNDSLFEVSEMLRVLQVEDCKWSSLDAAVDVRSTTEEKSRLLFTEDDRKPAEPSFCDPIGTEELAWDKLAGTVMTLTNFTYLSSLSPPPAPEPSRSQSADYVTPIDTSDYVTSTNSSDYVTSFDSSDYVSSFDSSDYITSFDSSDYVTSVNAVKM